MSLFLQIMICIWIITTVSVTIAYTDDSYYLRLITETTTGAINGWTIDRDEAYRRAEVKNNEKN